jgi:hypothetical protein
MFATSPTYGFSNEAQLIQRAAEEQRRGFRASAVLGNQTAIDELGSVWEECKDENWDGYHARAVTRDSLRNTYILLESLPLGCPVPSIGADPDGEFTVEWHRSSRRTLSVSVSDDGNLHYAALLGPNREYGTVTFFGDIPQDILRLIDRVYCA